MTEMDRRRFGAMLAAGVGLGSTGSLFGAESTPVTPENLLMVERGEEALRDRNGHRTLARNPECLGRPVACALTDRRSRPRL